MSRFANVGGTEPQFLDLGDGWYRGETINYFPKDRDGSREHEVDEIIHHVVKGWAPREKILRKSDMVTAFGSCFAQNVEGFLRKMGFTTSISRYGDVDLDNYWGQSLIIKCGDGFVNTFSIRNQFEWIFDDKMPNLRVWEKSEKIIAEYIDSNKDAAAQIFNETKFFVITLGLSEVWYNKITGDVL